MSSNDPFQTPGPDNPFESGSAGRKTERQFQDTPGASGSPQQQPAQGYIYDPTTQQFTPYAPGMVPPPGSYFYDPATQQYTPFGQQPTPAASSPDAPKAPHQDWYSQQAYQTNPANPVSKLRPLPNATAVLVLGIISIAVFWCYGIFGLACGIVALVLASSDMKKLKQNPDEYTGVGNLKAGRICAIIGVSLSSLYVLIVVIYFLIVGALFSSILGGALPH